MTIGFRVRGAQGNIQIDDQSPLFIVRERGVVPPAMVQDSNAYSFQNSHHVEFQSVITTIEPPLVFVKFLDVSRVAQNFTMRGQPGAWTGFNINLGIVYGARWVSNMAYFVATKTPSTGSGAKVGIRVRNRQTGAIVYDSGFPLVKFKQQTSDFKTAGRVTHEILRYSVGYPSGDVYFLINTLTGVFGRGSSTYYMSCGVEENYPGLLLLYVEGTSDIPYQSYYWTALFASPGN